MLKQMRNKKTAKKIWIAAIILILPAFLFWGVNTTMRGQKGADSAGVIAGKKVSLLDYRDAVNASRRQLVMRFGDSSAEMEKYINLESQAWDRLVLLDEAARRNVKVDDREVMEFVENYPLFQQKGRFDNRLYNESMQYVFHAQPRVFEEEVRQNLSILKLYKQVTDKIAVDDKEIEEAYRKANEEISIYYIRSAPSDFEKELTPSENELKDYFSENQLQFKQPSSFNIEYITADSEDKIKQARALLKKRNGLSLAAKKIGTEVKESGFFPETGAIPGIGWAPQVMSVISKLQPGKMAAPLELDNKYYVLKLKDRKEPYMPAFEEVKDRAKDAFIKTEGRRRAREKIESCLKELKDEYQASPKSVDLAKTAKKYNLKSEVSLPFKYASYIEGIGASDSFWLEAQNLKEDDFSGILEAPSGFYIIKVKSRSTIEAQKFQEEKPEFAKRVLLEKKEGVFGKFLADLKRKSRMF